MSNAQVTDSDGAAGPSGLIGSPSSCRVGRQEAVNTADIVRRLNSGELGPAAPAAKAVFVPILRCEDGPKRVSNKNQHRNYISAATSN